MALNEYQKNWLIAWLFLGSVFFGIYGVVMINRWTDQWDGHSHAAHEHQHSHSKHDHPHTHKPHEHPHPVPEHEHQHSHEIKAQVTPVR